MLAHFTTQYYILRVHIYNYTTKADNMIRLFRMIIFSCLMSFLLLGLTWVFYLHMFFSFMSYLHHSSIRINHIHNLENNQYHSQHHFAL